MATDPVCGMQVDEAGGTRSVEYAGETYYFCSEGCLRRFDAEPDLFTAGTGVGNLANDDRSADQERVPGAGPHARLEQPHVESGAG